MPSLQTPPRQNTQKEKAQKRMNEEEKNKNKKKKRKSGRILDLKLFNSN